MKKFVLMTMFLMLFTASFVTSAGAGSSDAVHNPKQHEGCFDADGKWNDKCGDPNACSCLFHEIAEYISDLFG